MRVIALALCLTLGSGCAMLSGSVLPVITRILTVVIDAQQIVDRIDDVVDVFFNAMPDSPYRDRYALAVGKVRSALNLIIRLSQGSKALDEERVDAAFADFKVAYQELIALLGEMRLAQPSQGGPLLAAKPGARTLLLPDPLALTFSVRAAR